MFIQVLTSLAITAGIKTNAVIPSTMATEYTIQRRAVKDTVLKKAPKATRRSVTKTRFHSP
jgi:hypothetical protein